MNPPPTRVTRLRAPWLRRAKLASAVGTGTAIAEAGERRHTRGAPLARLGTPAPGDRAERAHVLREPVRARALRAGARRRRRDGRGRNRRRRGAPRRALRG